MTTSKPSTSLAVEDIEYLRLNDRPLLARLYRPRGAGPFPAVVDVHGGAWTSQTRLQNAHIHRKLATSGITVLALDFSPAARRPISDSSPGNQLRHTLGEVNATRLGTHPTLIGGLGSSSGGHQMMLSALRPRDSLYAAIEAPSDTVDASLAFAILLWPVIDPLARYRMAQERQNRHLLDAHAAYFPNEDAMQLANPQLIVERGEAAQTPPMLYIQGTDDDNLLPEMPDRFADAYRRAGGDISVHKFEGQPHTFITKKPADADSDAAIKLIIAFIRERSAAALACCA